MFFDPLYLLIMLATGGLAIWSSVRVKRALARWQSVRSYAGARGVDVARAILRREGLDDVAVERVGGMLSDHYDPRRKVLRLSPPIYDGTSVAAAGVAAHEAGHAIQHARGYWPLQVRSYLAPAAAIGSNLSMFVIMLGAIVGALGLVKLGIVLFALMVLFTLVTLPVELDASARAKRLLPELGLTRGHDAVGVSAVLNAAAWTYVAAAVGAVAQLLYLVFATGSLDD